MCVGGDRKDWKREPPITLTHGRRQYSAHCDFASRGAQSPTNMLGSLLKQLVSGLGTIPVEITQKFQSQNNAIGDQRSRLPDIVKTFAAATSLPRTFICVDALDEFFPRNQQEVLDALGQILQRSPNTRVHDWATSTS